MQEFAHDRSNDLHFTQALVEKMLSKGFEDRVIAFSRDSGHIQGSANGRLAGFGNGGFLADGGARLVMGRIQTSKGDELANIVKAGDRTHSARSLAAVN